MRPDDHYFDPLPPPPPASYFNYPGLYEDHNQANAAGSPSLTPPPPATSRATILGARDNSSSVADDQSMTLDDQQSELDDSRTTSFTYNDFLEDGDARHEQEQIEEEDEDDGVDYDEDMSDDDGGVPLWLMNEGGFHGVLLPELEDETDASDDGSDMANLGYSHHSAPADLSVQAQEDIGLAPPISFNTFMDMTDHLQAAPMQATNPAAVSQQLEQLAGVFADEAGGFDGNHPTALSNPNPNTLGPENPGLIDFLRHWAWQSRCLQGLARERGHYPWLPQVNLQASERVPYIGGNHLEGDRFDFQGIDWMKLGVTRREARERRLLTYKNYVNKPGSDRWQVSFSSLDV